MERLAGTAKNVRHTVQVRSEGRRTDHLVLFEIAGKRLRFRGLEPVSIQAGDELVVVCEPGDKGFHTVLAYHNRTLDVRDHDLHPHGCTGCGCAPVLVPLILLGWFAYSITEEGWFEAAIPILFLIVFVGVYLPARRADAETAERREEAEHLLDG
jgi:putative Ca2+/H+ antiporter (TMEM165/GDT1 family)